MTLFYRNTFFRIEIIIASFFMLVIMGALFLLLPTYPEAAANISRRSNGVIQAVIVPLLKNAPYVPFATAASAVIYALISIVLIYFFFEKTQCPEILFFGFFVFSLTFEALRIMAPAKIFYNLPSVYLIISGRILLFSRYFGIFSLFAASVYASGLEVQNQKNIFLIICLAPLIIALGSPVDGLSWDSSFFMLTGYHVMFRLVEVGIALITMASFFIAAYIRGTKEYIIIGVGALLVFLGRNILLSADTWLTPLPGLLMLSLGTWFICTYLHRVYLWL
jgi:hypothetical protein